MSAAGDINSKNSYNDLSVLDSESHETPDSSKENSTSLQCTTSNYSQTSRRLNYSKSIGTKANLSGEKLRFLLDSSNNVIKEEAHESGRWHLFMSADEVVGGSTEGAGFGNAGTSSGRYNVVQDIGGVYKRKSENHIQSESEDSLGHECGPSRTQLQFSWEDDLYNRSESFETASENRTQSPPDSKDSQMATKDSPARDALSQEVSVQIERDFFHNYATVNTRDRISNRGDTGKKGGRLIQTLLSIGDSDEDSGDEIAPNFPLSRKDRPLGKTVFNRIYNSFEPARNRRARKARCYTKESPPVSKSIDPTSYEPKRRRNAIEKSNESAELDSAIDYDERSNNDSRDHFETTLPKKIIRTGTDSISGINASEKIDHESRGYWDRGKHSEAMSLVSPKNFEQIKKTDVENPSNNVSSITNGDHKSFSMEQKTATQSEVQRNEIKKQTKDENGDFFKKVAFENTIQSTHEHASVKKKENRFILWRMLEDIPLLANRLISSNSSEAKSPLVELKRDGIISSPKKPISNVYNLLNSPGDNDSIITMPHLEHNCNDQYKPDLKKATDTIGNSGETKEHEVPSTQKFRPDIIKSAYVEYFSTAALSQTGSNKQDANMTLENYETALQEFDSLDDRELQFISQDHTIKFHKGEKEANISISFLDSLKSISTESVPHDTHSDSVHQDASTPVKSRELVFLKSTSSKEKDLGNESLITNQWLSQNNETSVDYEFFNDLGEITNNGVEEEMITVMGKNNRTRNIGSNNGEKIEKSFILKELKSSESSFDEDHFHVSANPNVAKHQVENAPGSEKEERVNKNVISADAKGVTRKRLLSSADSTVEVERSIIKDSSKAYSKAKNILSGVITCKIEPSERNIKRTKKEEAKLGPLLHECEGKTKANNTNNERERYGSIEERIKRDIEMRYKKAEAKIKAKKEKMNSPKQLPRSSLVKLFRNHKSLNMSTNKTTT